MYRNFVNIIAVVIDIKHLPFLEQRFCLASVACRRQSPCFRVGECLFVILWFWVFVTLGPLRYFLSLEAVAYSSYFNTVEWFWWY